MHITGKILEESLRCSYTNRWLVRIGRQLISLQSIQMDAQMLSIVLNVMVGRYLKTNLLIIIKGT
jgi:hypothetical protein